MRENWHKIQQSYLQTIYWISLMYMQYLSSKNIIVHFHFHKTLKICDHYAEKSTFQDFIFIKTSSILTLPAWKLRNSCILLFFNFCQNFVHVSSILWILFEFYFLFLFPENPADDLNTGALKYNSYIDGLSEVFVTTHARQYYIYIHEILREVEIWWILTFPKIWHM